MKVIYKWTWPYLYEKQKFTNSTDLFKKGE